MARRDGPTDPRYTDPEASGRSVNQFHERSSTRNIESDEDEESWAPLMRSFRSEGRQGGRPDLDSPSTERFRRRSGSVGGNLSRGPARDWSLSDPPDLNRGRKLGRERREISSNRETRTAASSRARRKGATMDFLAVWALFGIGTLSGPERPRTTNVGRVLVREEVPVVLPILPYYSLAHTALVHVKPNDSTTASLARQDPPGEISNKRILGRVFAWMCTTLYLTSRLPQIWKNVRLSFYILLMQT